MQTKEKATEITRIYPSTGKAIRKEKARLKTRKSAAQIIHEAVMAAKKK
jgi:hypothetical protein